MVWKTRVIRRIDTRDSIGRDEKVYAGKYGDTALSKFLLDAVFGKKIKGRRVFQGRFYDTIFSRKDRYYFGLDLWSGEANDYTIFNLLEDWEFDPYTYQTTVSMAGIEMQYYKYFRVGENPPGEAIDWALGETNKTYLWTTDLFWFKWEDAKELLITYAQNHPGKNIQQYWWDRVFETAGDSTYVLDGSDARTWKKKTFKCIEVLTDTSYRHHAYGEVIDWRFLGNILYDSINQKRLKPYTADLSAKAPAPYERMPVETDTFTEEVFDPVTSATRKIQRYRRTPLYIEWYEYRYYTVSSEWTFDVAEGWASQKNVGLEPRLDLNYYATDLCARQYPSLYNPHPFFNAEKNFWLRFEDVRGILQTYDSYHPTSSFSLALWESYFLRGRLTRQ